MRIQNQTKARGTMKQFIRTKQYWISIGLLCLALLNACQVASATQVVSSTPMSTQVSPQQMATEPSAAPQPGYSQVLSAALAACAQMERDQACYGSGAGEASSSSGSLTASFAKPGDLVDLTDVSAIAVHPTGSSNSAGGLALLKLQVDFEESGQFLTLAVIGDVAITRLQTDLSGEAPASPAAASTTTPIDGAAGPDSGSPYELLQEVDFTSFDNPTMDSAAPNGLLIWTPPGDDLASIKINGAEITLGSMALIESSGGSMTISMLEGSAIVQAGGDSGFVSASNQVSVPLDSAGMANGAPGPAVVIDPRLLAISEAINQYGVVDPRAEAISNAVDQYPSIVVRDFTRRFDRAIRRCTDAQSPDPHYVYNTLYYYNRLVSLSNDADFQSAMRPNLLEDMAAKARSCLSFELDFDSTIKGRLERLALRGPPARRKNEGNFQCGRYPGKGGYPTLETSGIFGRSSTRRTVYANGCLSGRHPGPEKRVVKNPLQRHWCLPRG